MSVRLNLWFFEGISRSCSDRTSPRVQWCCVGLAWSVLWVYNYLKLLLQYNVELFLSHSDEVNFKIFLTFLGSYWCKGWDCVRATQWRSRRNAWVGFAETCPDASALTPLLTIQCTKFGTLFFWVCFRLRHHRKFNEFSKTNKKLFTILVSCESLRVYLSNDVKRLLILVFCC